MSHKPGRSSSTKPSSSKSNSKKKQPERESTNDREEREQQEQDDRAEAEAEELPDAADDSLPESDVDDELYGPDDEFVVDAIKWAKYIDTSRTRQAGGKAWYYGTMWNNYLKAQSDTEEPRTSFIVADENGVEKTPMVDEFWKGAGRPIVKGRKEPGGRLGEVVETPPKLLKRWFRRSNPRRDYPTYARRRAKELAGLPVQRRDSDHYVHKKKMKMAADAKAAEAAAGPSAEAGLSGVTELDGDDKTADTADDKAKDKGKGKDKDVRAPPSPAPSPGSSLYSLFSDSETDDEADEDVVAIKPVRSKKRGRIIGSPDLSPRALKKKKLKEEKRAAERKTARDEREKSSKEKADKLKKLGSMKKKDPFVAAPAPTPMVTSPIKAPKPKSQEKYKSKLPPRRSPTPQEIIPVISSPLPQAVPRQTVVVSSPPPQVIEPPAPPPVAGPLPAAAPRLSEIFPPSPAPAPAAPPPRAAASPTVGGSIFGAADRGIFGAADATIFGAADENIFGSTTESGAPSPKATKTRRDNQEPLFDFGDVEMSASQPTPMPQAADSPDEVVVLLPEPEAQADQATPEVQSEARSEGQPEAQSEVPETQPEPSGPAINVDGSSAAEDEMPSSIPTNQIRSANAPSLMVTEAIPTRPEAVQAPPPPTEVPQPPAQAPSPPPAQPSPVSRPSLPRAPSPPAQSTTGHPSLPPKPSMTMSPKTAHRRSSSGSGPGSFFENLPPSGIIVSGGASMSPTTDPKSLPPSQRPKYKQPQRIKIDAPIDPARNRRLPNGPPSATSLTSPHSPLTALEPLGHPASAAPQTSAVTRVQEILQRQNEQAAKETRQKQAELARRRGQAAQVNLPDPYRQTQRQTSGGRTPPGYGSVSPYDGGRSPVHGNKSPQWGGRSPNGGTDGDGGNRPGAAAYGMTQPYPPAHMPPPQPPIQQPVPQSVYEPSRDPRNRARGGAPAAPPPGGVHPSRATLIAANAPNAASSEFLVTVGRAGSSEAQFPLRVEEPRANAARTLLPYARDVRRRFEPMDRNNLDLVIAQGAKVTEYAQLHLEDGAANCIQSNWDVVQGQLAAGMIFLSTDEVQATTPLTAHTFVFIAAAVDAHLHLAGASAADTANLKVVAGIVSVPLDSDAIPNLPNPVRPDFVTGEAAPRPPALNGELRSIVEAYGFDRSAAQKLKGGTFGFYPSQTGGLYSQVIVKAKEMSLPPSGSDVPNTFVLINNYWSTVTKSSAVGRGLLRRTRMYALGPDFGVPVSMWRLREIWKAGGLVTFSPTFILRSPDKFAEVMEQIRSAPGWAAYVPPTTIAWCEDSWGNKVRCPYPSKTFATLTSLLFMDNNMRQLATPSAPAAGGLAVSFAPPQLSYRDACTKWLDWLRRAFQADAYEPLLELCHEARLLQAQLARKDPSAQPPPLDLLSVELEGINDLIAMRSRPHILPYRRYIYIGSLSNRPEANRIGDKAVEFVDADDFVALLSADV